MPVTTERLEAFWRTMMARSVHIALERRDQERLRELAACPLSGFLAQSQMLFVVLCAIGLVAS